jgi:hypothetical protein
MDQRLYHQIAAGIPPNTSSCWSGCGATGWSMLFGWADFQAANGNSYWAPRWGLYRANSGTGMDAVAPRNQDAGVANMTWEIRNDIQTFCILGNGATWPWKMVDASNYLAGRTGTSLSTYYNVFGITQHSIRRRVADSIIDRGTPAVIGIALSAGLWLRPACGVVLGRHTNPTLLLRQPGWGGRRQRLDSGPHVVRGGDIPVSGRTAWEWVWHLNHPA